MRLYDTVLFDLDGTLTDSAPGIFNSFRYALRAMGAPAPTTDQLRPCVGPPLSVSFEQVFGFRGGDIAEAVRQYRVYYERTGIFENSVYPGVPELLERLRGSGLRLAVASSKKEASVRRVVEHFHLEGFFDHLGGSDDAVGRSAKPEVVDYVLAALGEPDRRRTALVGDRHHDIDGAKLCRIAPVGILWGYGSREELTNAGAVHIADTPESLYRLLAG